MRAYIERSRDDVGGKHNVCGMANNHNNKSKNRSYRVINN